MKFAKIVIDEHDSITYFALSHEIGVIPSSLILHPSYNNMFNFLVMLLEIISIIFR